MFASRALALSLLVLTGCQDASDKREFREVLEREMRDPGSAHYRNEQLRHFAKGTALCGEVNVKNGFGGYIGFRRFVSYKRGALVDEDTLQPSDKDLFKGLWRDMCQPPSPS